VPIVGYTLLAAVNFRMMELLKEPNHLDFKVQNKFGEWVWKSPYAMNRYADLWEQWHEQERQLFKEKHGLSDEELNYYPEQHKGADV
jgi:hypothetical protein